MSSPLPGENFGLEDRTASGENFSCPSDLGVQKAPGPMFHVCCSHGYRSGGSYFLFDTNTWGIDDG